MWQKRVVPRPVSFTGRTAGVRSVHLDPDTQNAGQMYRHDLPGRGPVLGVRLPGLSYGAKGRRGLRPRDSEKQVGPPNVG